MATDLSAQRPPYTHTISSVAAAETITINASEVQLVEVYIDTATASTQTLGGGDAVPIATQEWAPLYIAPRVPRRDPSVDLVVTPGASADVHVRLS